MVEESGRVPAQGTETQDRGNDHTETAPEVGYGDESAYPMSAHWAGEGDAALPSDPSLTAAPGRRFRAVVRLVAGYLHRATVAGRSDDRAGPLAVVVDAVPCRAATSACGP